jgi:hypothetical protein
VKRWSVWCQPKDGTKNGRWVGERSAMALIFFSRAAAVIEWERNYDGFPDWYFEIRELLGEEK